MIGIYGGTFDPVHYGHLRTALEIKALFQLAEVRLIPCARPPHRGDPLTSAEQRLTMLALALENQPGLVVDDCELKRSGPSYTVDTLAGLRAQFKRTPLLLFMGADAFAGLSTWHQWRRLFDYAHIVVMTRPGYRLPADIKQYGDSWVTDSRQLSNALAGKLFFQTVTQLDISATAIRAMIANGQDPRFLLPDKVLTYIQQNKLYTSPIPAHLP